MDKADLRRHHRALRQALDPQERLRRSLSIQAKAWEILKLYESVGLYISTDMEVSTRWLINRLLSEGKRVCVPKILGGHMIFVEIRSLDECVPQTLGILEPLSDVQAPAPQVQVIPMLAYNAKGFRLGYGKGYYDRYLKDYPGVRVGLCFKMDLDERLNESAFDISCQSIITD